MELPLKHLPVDFSGQNVERMALVEAFAEGEKQALLRVGFT